MNHKKIYVLFSFLASIVFTQESIPFDISKQFAVPLENNQLIWNSDISFNNLLIDRSTRNFKTKFEKLNFEVLPKDSSYVKSKFIYEFGDYGYDKIKCSKLSLSSSGKFLTSVIYLLTMSLERIAFPTKDLWFDLEIEEPRLIE